MWNKNPHFALFFFFRSRLLAPFIEWWYKFAKTLLQKFFILLAVYCLNLQKTLQGLQHLEMGLQNFVLIWICPRFNCLELGQKDPALELKKKDNL